MSLTTNIYAFYDLDGSLADANGTAARDLTDAGATYAAGLVGQCVASNGGQNLSWASGVNFSARSWSAQAWFLVAGAGADGNGGNVSLAIGASTVFSLTVGGNGGDPGGFLIARAGNGGGGSGTAVSDGWNHAVVTWDATTARFYVNGALAQSFTPTVTSSTAAATFAVSASGDFDNPIDLVGFWLDRVLTGAGGDVTDLNNSMAGLSFAQMAPTVTVPGGSFRRPAETWGRTFGRDDFDRVFTRDEWGRVWEAPMNGD